MSVCGYAFFSSGFCLYILKKNKALDRFVSPFIDSAACVRVVTEWTGRVSVGALAGGVVTEAAVALIKAPGEETLERAVTPPTARGVCADCC